MIWIVYNGWMGNGQVAVIVEAEHEEEARLKAQMILAAERPGDGEAYDSWTEITEVEQIKLPYLTEIG